MSASHSNSDRSLSFKRFAFLFLAAIAAQTLLRAFFPAPVETPAGEARGDIVLPDDCLPGTIGSWEQTEFYSAQSTAEKGSSLWSDQWLYKSKIGRARVSFDQAGYTGWHELSDCYVGNGWTHMTREIVEQPSGEWPCVVSTFKDPSGQQLLVAFSLFFDEGTGVYPPAYELSRPADEQKGLADNLRHRLSDLHLSRQRLDPTRQCQVMTMGSGDFSAEIREAVVSLHLETRSRLISHWRDVMQGRARVEKQQS